MIIRAVPANFEHAEVLARNLSFLDRQEIAVYREMQEVTNQTITESLLSGVKHSTDVTSLIDETGFVYAMWGIIELHDAHDHDDVFGCPWLLSVGSEHYSLASTRALLKATKASIELWHEWYDRIEGISWAGATEHHKLLRKLGFELSEPTTVSVTGSSIPPTIMFVRVTQNIAKGVKYYV